MTTRRTSRVRGRGDHGDPAAVRRGAVAVLLAALVAGCSAGGPATSNGSPSPTASSAATSSPGAASSTSPAPSSTATGTPTGPAALPRPDHVLVVVMENHAAADIVGNTEAPFIDSLSRSGATFTRSYAVTHPSEPNYLALFSGSTQGVDSDACPLTFDGSNLATALHAAGRTFVGWSEGLPAPGSRVCRAGGYARKHNPWVDFAGVPASANQPLTAFPADFRALPHVGFVIPTLDHDMHDGSIAAGDAWLSDHLGGYVRWARTHNSLLVLTFDEDDDDHANRIATIVVGEHVRPGPFTERVDHYRVLRMLGDLMRVPPVGEAARAAPVTGIWAR